MNRKHKNVMKTGRVRDEVRTQEGGGKMTIAQATMKWNDKFPETPVTQQTIRNWTSKFGLGEKCSFLPRSHWIIEEKKFNEFLKDPRKFLNQKADKRSKKNA